MTPAAQTPASGEGDDRGQEHGVRRVRPQHGGERNRDQRAERSRRDRRESGAEAERDEVRRMSHEEAQRRRGGTHRRSGGKWSKARGRCGSAAPFSPITTSPASRTMEPMRTSGSGRTVAIASTCTALRARRREQELVVVAAGEQAFERERALRAGELRRERERSRNRGELDARPDVRAVEHVSEIAGKPVRKVDRGGRDAAQREAKRHARLRSIESAATLAQGVGGERRASGERRDRERRVAEGSGDPDVVARLRMPSRECAPGGHFAHDRDAEVARPARRIAADEVDAVRVGKREESPRERLRATPDRRPAAQPASSAQRGVAPIAARSDRFTASVLCPSASGSAPATKCRPSTSMSTDTATSQPGVGTTSAASSPTPSATDLERGGRVK